MLVFKTVNILNGKVFIGSSTKNNPNFLGSSKALLKDIRKFGIKNFQREVIEHCETKSELFERERYWIQQLKAYNKSIGYNSDEEITNELLNKKIQVLLTKSELKDLNTVILNEAYAEQIKPMSVSSYARKIINAHVSVILHEQKSYVKMKTKELI